MIRLLRRIRHGVRSRRARYAPIVRDFIRSLWAQICIGWKWRVKSGGRPHRLPGVLVVSLTSYPARFGTLSLTLRSLLLQTVRPDHTVLWIAHADMPLLPKSVTRLQAAGLEIRATDDIKSYKKIFPALDAFSSAFICTADDDLYYWPTWLEELIEGVNTADHIVTCHRAHQIAFDSKGKFLPYQEWVPETRVRGTLDSLFPTSGSGVLFPPGVLAHAADDREAALSLCPSGDDIWLYWIGRRNGAIYKTVGRWREPLTWRGSQREALWPNNILNGGNDEQIRKMAARYGYPDRQS
jgi:hypothetical protein